MQAYQNALVALVTRASFRERLRHDPSILDTLGLSEAEAQALRGLDPLAVDRVAAGLLAKRAAQLAQALPLSCRVAPSIPRRYRAWLADHPAQVADTPLPPGIAEALRALRVVATQVDDDDGEAPFAGDLLRYETLRTASSLDRVPREVTLRWPVPDWVPDLRAGVLPFDPEPLTTRLRFP